MINSGHVAISFESTGQTFGHDIPLQKHIKISYAQQTLQKYTTNHVQTEVL
jgi:hypothetical protein